jgi:hypothetical protein
MKKTEIALKMYLQEHNRWSQWALFFLGSIISIFTISDKLNLPALENLDAETLEKFNTLVPDHYIYFMGHDTFRAQIMR